MSRSCHSATFSNAASAFPRRSRARPQIRSESSGFRLWGIALEPFCPSPNGSCASSVSVRWSPRTSSAIFSRDAPATASVAQNSAWRSRWTICVDTGAASSPSSPHTSVSSSGSTWAKFPTAPESFPTATAARARHRRSRFRCASVYHTAAFSPKLVGSAWTPWVRPTVRVSLWRSASARSAFRRRSCPAMRRSAASRSWSASAVSQTSLVVRPIWTKRESGPSCSSRLVRSAIISCLTRSWMARIRATSTRAVWRMRAIASEGMRPRRAPPTSTMQLAREVAAIEGPERGQDEAVLVEELGDERLHLLVADGVDRREHGVDREERAQVHLVLGEPIHPARRRLERQHQAALQMILGASELLLRHAALLYLTELLEDRLEDLGEVRRVARGIDVERPRVDVRLDARMDRVDEPLALPHLLEEARGHTAADHIVQDEQGVALGRRVVQAREAHDDVDLLERLVDDVDPGLHERGRVRARCHRASEAVEAAPEEVDDPVVGDVARDRDHDAWRHVLLAEVGEHRRAIVTVHRLARAEDRASERMALPELCGEEVMDQVVGRVLHHLDLLEHNRLYALELLGVEDRVQEDVGQEIDRERQVLVEHLDIEAGVLLRGEGVHLAADRVHRARDGLGGARLGALEDEGLDEGGHADSAPWGGGGSRPQPEGRIGMCPPLPRTEE